LTDSTQAVLPAREALVAKPVAAPAQAVPGFFPGTGTAGQRRPQPPAPPRRGFLAGLGLFLLGVLTLAVLLAWGFYVWMIFDEGSFFAHTALVDSAETAATKTPPTTRSELVKVAEELHLIKQPQPAPPQVKPAPVPPPEPPAVQPETRGDYLPPLRHLGENYTVQIAASETPIQAEKILAKLKDLGFDGYFYRVHVKGRPYFRVRVGRFEGFSQAKELERELTGHGFAGMFIANLDDEARVEKP
jgi:cell division septation protein DedD